MDKITEINLAILDMTNTADTNEICDGYHTFGELYEHRVILFMALCHRLPASQVWKSRLHSDGSAWAGWFIAGINSEPGQQISYHLPESKWDMLRVPELTTAPEYDGHTSDQVIERLERILSPVSSQAPAMSAISIAKEEWELLASRLREDGGPADELERNLAIKIENLLKRFPASQAPVSSPDNKGQSWYLQLTPAQLEKLAPGDQARYFQDMARKHPEGYPLDINQPITSEIELAMVRSWWNNKVLAGQAPEQSSQAPQITDQPATGERWSAPQIIPPGEKKIPRDYVGGYGLNQAWARKKFANWPEEDHL